MRALTGIVEALSVPLMILNMFGGIVSGIWLAVLRDWHSLLLGIAIFLLSTAGLGWVFIPSTLLAVPAAYFYEKKMVIRFVCFSTLSNLYSYAVITVWCCGVLFLFASRATSSTLLPRLVWSYGIATEPFAYMAYNEYRQGEEGTASQLATFFAQLGYLFVMVLIMFSPITLIGVIKLFGGFMLFSFVVQIWTAIRMQRTEGV